MRRALRSPCSSSRPLAACATNPATGKREFSLVSEETKSSLVSRKRKVAASMPALQNQAVQDMVKRMGMAMAKSSERPDLPWSFYRAGRSGRQRVRAPRRPDLSLRAAS